MSLWNTDLRKLLNNQKKSLQERTFSTKTLKDSLSNPTIPNGSKGGLCFACLYGSVTVELAVVFPLFLFAMINILSLFLMFQSYGLRLAQLHQSGRQLAVLAHLQGEETEETDIELVSAEYVKPLAGIMGYRGCLVVSGCVMHKWIGYDLQGESWKGSSTENVVFVAKNGDVYHSRRSCSYLNPSVQTVKLSEVSGLRNGDGSRYSPCLTCTASGELVYITGDGERYHSTVTCSGLKRTVDCMTEAQAREQGKRSCSRCGGQERSEEYGVDPFSGI